MTTAGYSLGFTLEVASTVRQRLRPINPKRELHLMVNYRMSPVQR